MNLKKCVVIVGIVFFSLSSSVYADDITGEKIYAKKLKRICGFNGDVFAKKYTQNEWQKIYEENRLNKVLQKHCPGIDIIKSIQLPHLYKFFYKYAKDSGNEPNC